MFVDEGDVVKNVILGDYVEDKVPHLKYFMSKENKDQEHTIPPLAALSSAMRLLQKYDFHCYCPKQWSLAV